MALKTAITSSLVKIFENGTEFSPLKSISLFGGEKGNFQLVVKSDCDTTVEISSDKDFLTLYFVNGIYSSFPINKEDCGDILLENGGRSGFYPDLLTPVFEPLSLKADKMYSVWVNVDTKNIPSGTYNVKLKVTDGKEEYFENIKIKVLSQKLPEQTLIHTNWFHSDCLSVYYNVPVFSDEYWRITRNFVKNAVSHGVNCILTPLFTPPLDTQVGKERPTVQTVKVRRRKNYRYEFDFTLLEKWIDMCLECGIKYFEFSHFFTQWGALHAPKIMADTPKGEKRIFGWETSYDSTAYMNFLSQLGTALKEFTDKKKITDICFVHCSDEPSLNDLKVYKKAAESVAEYFPYYKHIDALSDADFYKLGLIDIPVSEEGSIEKFTPLVKRPWTYFCCGQYKNNLPNRFFALPSIKNRILGTLLYKYNCAGFLHWGFNFYFSQYSVRQINPFEESDAGGAFPSGDAYVVYPKEDGTPLPSLRQKVFYDALQDISALTALENKYSREFVLDFLKNALGDIDFNNYPLESETFLNFREKLCEFFSE